MKNYELTVLLHPDLEMNPDPVLDKVRKTVQGAGGEITKEEYEGKMNSVMSQLDGDLSHFDDIIKANFADVLATADNFDEA